MGGVMTPLVCLTMRRNNSLPLVSAIIPVKNGAAFISDAINSILNQHHKPSEIIVVDDGSEDQTAAAVKQFGHQVIFIQNHRRGTASARNIGVNASRHSLIAFLDADDISRPERFTLQAQQLATFPNAALSYCAFNYFTDNGGVKPILVDCPDYSPEKFVGLLFERNRIGSASLIMARKAAFESVGGFDETFGSHSEDYDLWLRLAQHKQLCYIDHPLVNIRLHRENTSSQKELQTRNEIRALKRHSRGSIQKALRKAYPNKLEAELAMVCVLFRMNDYHHAQLTLAKLHTFNTKHYLINFYEGNLALLNRKPKTAATHFASSLNFNQTFAPAHNNLGVSLALLGMTAQARQSFCIAGQHAPFYHDPVWNLMILDQEKGAEHYKKTMVPLRPVLRPEPILRTLPF